MRKFAWSLLLLPAFLRVASACSCAGYPEPFCARNLSRIDSKQTVVFVGRVTSAPGGFQELKDEMSAAGQSRDGAAGVTVHRSGSEELAQSVEQARGALLDSYGARLSDKQRALLRNAKSMVELLELRPMLYELGRPVRLEVVENLIGELPRSVEIFTGRGGGDCGFDFAPGELYVVEAHRNSNGEWHSWMCSSRVSPLEFATEDLRTLRAWKAGKPLAPRIYGVAEDWTTRQNRHSFPYPAIRGLNLMLSNGTGTLRTTTDAEGRFRFEGLTPDTYSLKLEETRWSLIGVSDGHRPIDLKGKGCAVLSLNAKEQQGVISGRVLPQPGEELPDHLWIEAIAKEEGGTEPFDASADRRDGRFEIDEIEPGDYLVSINVKNSPSGPHSPQAKYGRVWPYGPTYYPGVADPSKAAVFRIERGQTITLADWMLPLRLAERQIKGVAILPTGARAADVRITLRRPGIEEVAGRIGPTGSDGQFTVWALETLSYDLEGAAYDPVSQVVYRGKLDISGDETKPLTLLLEATDEKPTDERFFDEYLWRKK